MITKKAYRYIGRNGILTTRIHLDGINYIPMVELIAEQGKILTNGEITVYTVTIEETDVSLWKEIPDTAKKN